jgi:hypothetical protein
MVLGCILVLMKKFARLELDGDAISLRFLCSSFMAFVKQVELRAGILASLCF